MNLKKVLKTTQLSESFIRQHWGKLRKHHEFYKMQQLSSSFLLYIKDKLTSNEIQLISIHQKSVPKVFLDTHIYMLNLHKLCNGNTKIQIINEYPFKYYLEYHLSLNNLSLFLYKVLSKLLHNETKKISKLPINRKYIDNINRCNFEYIKQEYIDKCTDEYNFNWFNKNELIDSSIVFKNTYLK